MRATYLATWRCARCDVAWAKDAGPIACWYCHSDRHVGPSVDECVVGGILELPAPAPPLTLPDQRVGRGLPVNLVIFDEVHEWAAGIP